MTTSLPPTGTRPLSWRKKLLFSGILFLLGWGILEAAAAFYLGSFDRSMVSFWERVDDISKNATPGGMEAIHPYLGWCLDPRSDRAEMFGQPVPVNRLGFVDPGPSILKRDPKKLIVGICGGSVAQQVALGARDALVTALREDPRYRDREIEVVSLAMAGYKQPQQVMAVNYVMALGGEFDVLVNIDGYNEIALPGVENFQSRISYAYPRMWHARLITAIDPRQSADALAVLTLKGQRQQLARDLLSSPFRFSYLRLFLWHVRDVFVRDEMHDLEIRIGQEQRSEGRGMTRDGPLNTTKTLAAVQTQAIELWKTSSLQLSRLCRGAGIRYIHVLQPNQYLPGSKPLTEIEQEKMIVPDQEYGRMVAQYYPQMIAEGTALRGDGLRFLDLTGLFRETREQVYIDFFCHFNELGVRAIAAAIAQEILADEEADSPIDRKAPTD